MDKHIIPAVLYKHELHISNSRFIATISPAFSVEEAKKFIQKVKNQYSDANHNVPVYLIGFGSSVIAHSNDDGEPPGTAGRPALSVLSGSGLGDTALVITRYFGGTKLGTGGLVKAYGDSARLVIESVPKAVKLQVHFGELECPYPLYDRIKKLIQSHQGEIHEQSFLDTIKLQFSAPNELYDLLSAKIIEISSGHVNPRLFKRDQIRIKPLNS